MQENFAVMNQKFKQTGLTLLKVIRPKDANEMAKSEDSNLTTPLKVIRSGSALFAHIHLSKNLGSLGYSKQLHA